MQERVLVTPRDQDEWGRKIDKAKKFVINKLNEYEAQKKFKLSKKLSAQA